MTSEASHIDVSATQAKAPGLPFGLNLILFRSNKRFYLYCFGPSSQTR
ncbi:hypothetical protein KSC_087350 [Ktedonobacter sp. SOSP1-52]|nr:hypothetical protein KSC_087350 [Ktedonobacter sp. SOSP1-52]